MKTVSKKLLSIMLVALLLVSAVPFQAFADHDALTHVMGAWASNSDGTHHRDCTDASCTYTESNPCTYVNGICSICGYACPHGTTSVVGKVAPTCVKDGYTGDTVCSVCGVKTATGTVDKATGVHTFVNGHCTNCTATQAGAAHILTLDANGGTVQGGVSMVVNVNQFSPIGTLPDAVRPGYTFAGWFIDGSKVELGQTYPFDADKVAVAKWTEQTYLLTVKRVLNGDSSTAKTIYTGQVSKGTNLLDFLKANVTATVNYERSITPGFTWENAFWYDFSGTQPLTAQSVFMNEAQTVYVNFKSNAYTLYFHANGGVVTPSSKTVYFGSAVGTLPTPTKSGSVFQGWKDANGTLYTAQTVYQVAGDTNLTAVWSDEALVLLRVYINGDFSAPNRIIIMDGFVKNSNISREDVVSQVQKFYTASSGYLNIAGLFDDYTWGSYRANTSKAGTPNIAIDKDHTNNIYVMVTNAYTGSTVVNGTTSGNGTYTGTTGSNNGAYWVSTGNGTGYWAYPNGTTVTGSNPKTGDTAMIEAAAAIMVLAAGALVTIMTMRKRKMI